MAEMLLKAQKYMNAEDALAAIRDVQKPREKETLRSYVKRFTRETLEVDEADDKVQLTTFKAGLRSRDLVASLAKNPPKTMAEMLLKAQKYMNAEYALAAVKDVEKTLPKGNSAQLGKDPTGLPITPNKAVIT